MAVRIPTHTILVLKVGKTKPAFLPPVTQKSAYGDPMVTMNSNLMLVPPFIIVPAGHVYSSGGVCVGAQGGRGGKKWGSLLVAGIQNEGVITYSAL